MLKVQHLLHICSEHYEAKDKDGGAKEKDKKDDKTKDKKEKDKKDKDKKEDKKDEQKEKEEETADLSQQQGSCFDHVMYNEQIIAVL